MRIGLISDTHIPEAAQALPPQVRESFQRVDLILHAGDIYIPSVMDELARIAPLLVAIGDDDPLDLLEDERVEEKHVLQLDGHTIWVTHERPVVFPQMNHDSPDIVVFGHEHRAMVQQYGKVLFVNSGSPTFLDYRLGLGTVGILDIHPNEVRASILHL